MKAKSTTERNNQKHNEYTMYKNGKFNPYAPFNFNFLTGYTVAGCWRKINAETTIQIYK